MAKECITCMRVCTPYQKNQLPSLVSDCGTILSSVVHRPNSKYHTSLMTKRHVDDLRGITSQEWEDILAVLKSDVNKIEKLCKFKGKPVPSGYRISMPCGAKASQNEPPHFYVRLVPKYKKKWGTVAIPAREKKEMKTDDFAREKKRLQESLRPDSENVVAQKSKIIAKLQDEECIITSTRENSTGYVVISTKSHLPNDINAIDPETWQEIGQTLKETMAKIEANTDCHDFGVEIKSGKEAVKMWREEAELPTNCDYPESEFTVHLYPMYKTYRWWKGERPVEKGKVFGSMENERYAEELRDPEGYAKIWGKSPPRRVEESASQTKSLSPEAKKEESLWKQPYLYLAFVGGLLIAGLGFVLFSSATRPKKSK